MVARVAHPETRRLVSWVPRAPPAPRVLRVLRDHPGLRVLKGSRVLRAPLASALAALLPLPELLQRCRTYCNIVGVQQILGQYRVFQMFHLPTDTSDGRQFFFRPFGLLESERL